jgi:drug/metabolite transporter (DMT)-like permease
MEYLLIFASLCFTLGGQLLQKLAANKAESLSTPPHFLHRLFLQHETWWAIISLGIATLIWLLVLFYMEVSKAFPFLSLSFVVILLISRFFLNETVSKQRWLGVAFITLGIALVSLS